MQVSRRDFLRLSGASAAIAGLGLPALQWRPARAATFDDPLVHLLNRMTWGVRPETLARATEIGYESFLDEQLNPETLDDSAADALLENLPILQMNRLDAHSLNDANSRCYEAISNGMILRAVHSERQLLERMVEFWADHFNVSSDDLMADMVGYLRDAIRSHALGNFRDLVLATAKHPAMLYYLDNYSNIAKHPNENYARELLELHTLGVDGGYTEADVLTVAKALTGWTVHDGVPDGFYFDDTVHDKTEKRVLGHTLPAERGIEDGLHVISLVVNHPATAQFISRKLCRRFVSDEPPQSLVDSTAAVFMETRGEIKPVLRHLFMSTEFQQSVGQKLRRPLEFYIAAMRATGIHIREKWIARELLTDLAQLPFGWAPPDGYPDVASAWMSTSGLLARWNVAMYFTHTAWSEDYTTQGVSTEINTRIGEVQTVDELVDAVATQVFGLPLPAEERATFVAFAADGGDESTPVDMHRRTRKLASLFGLMLASPYFQWR